MRLTRLLSILAAIVVAASLSNPARGCGTVLRPLPMSIFDIVDETAVIAWDSRTHTEHFVRTATFNTNASDLGFIVPTPSTPTLTVADPKVLDRLTTLSLPKTLTGDRYEFEPFSVLEIPFLYFLGSTAGTKLNTVSANIIDDDDSSVKVESTQQIAGLDTTTLAASDASALGKWLKRRHYGWSPALAKWLAPYVDKGWKITVFRYAKPKPDAPSLSTQLIDMAFQTDKPFYPYSEPQRNHNADATYEPRTLRVFMLSDRRMSGLMDKNPSAKDWGGYTIYAAPVSDSDLSSIGSALHISLPPQSWLTSFDDTSSPRPGYADVSFTPSSDPAPIIPDPIDNRRLHIIVIPLDLIVIAAIVVGRIRRRRRDKMAVR